MQKKRKVINNNTGEILNSVKEAANIANLEYSYFIKMLKNKIRNSTIFEYFD